MAAPAGEAFPVSTDSFALLEQFLEVPSPSGAEGDYAALLADELARRGFAVERQWVAPGRPNLIARPAGGEQPRVWFCTHIDVVPPHLPIRREGQRLYGRGAADTKGPLVAMLLAAEALAREGVSAGFLLVVGEEVDHCGARAAAAAGIDLAGARIILGEPTSNRVVAAQKGLLKLRACAEGRAGHSAFPDRGVSAIHRLLDFLGAARGEAWPQDPVLGPTTLNVGTIHGGVAANVFAPSAEAELLFRLVSAGEPLRERLAALAGEGVRLEVISANDPVRLEVPAGHPTTVVPFNTDASYLAPLGPVWLCGPGAIEVAHSDQEHIDRAELEEGAALYLRLARAASGG